MKETSEFLIKQKMFSILKSIADKNFQKGSVIRKKIDCTPVYFYKTLKKLKKLRFIYLEKKGRCLSVSLTSNGWIVLNNLREIENG